jgi:lipoate-protein ligase A
LENAERGELTLRCYSWEVTTVSLGYFQRAEQRLEHAPSRTCPLVRRASGGGALVHDTDRHELTYSVAVPRLPRLGRAPQVVYDTFHGSLIRALSEFGVAAESCPDNGPAPQPAPFLCFLRHAAGDVMVGPHKVAGSAQRRGPTALLQHGSLLLSRSAGAPELPGVAECSGAELAAADFRAAWLATLRQSWPVTWQIGELSPAEVMRVRHKVAEKFGHASWTGRR